MSQERQKDLMLAALAFAVLWLSMGAMGAIIIMAIIAVHEQGHVIAFRQAGHPDARWSFVPFFGGVAFSAYPPRSQVESAYISLMGPGFSLIFLVGLLIAARLMEGSYWGSIAGYAAMLCGAINAFNLLPLWPLDGGKALRATLGAMQTRWLNALTMAMSLGMTLLAFRTGAMFLLIFALASVRTLRGEMDSDRWMRPPNRRVRTMLLGAHALCFAAHAAAAGPLLRLYLGI